MSTRWYPIYQRGNPQLRVFLPNFWVKMVRPDKKPTPPENVVVFHCSMEMTDHDVGNYLKKIYNLPVVNVYTEVRLGRFFKDPFKNYIKKTEDYKVAHVTLPKDTKFEFPEMFAVKSLEEDKEKAQKQVDLQHEEYKKFLKQSKDCRGTPGWFSF